MTKIEMLRALIAKETDEKELVRLSGELEQEIKAEAIAEYEAKEADAAAAKARDAVKAEATGTPVKIVVGDPELYLGYNLKAEKSKLLSAMQSRMPKIHARMKENPEGTDEVVKMFLHKIHDAFQSPGSVVKSNALSPGTSGGFLGFPQAETEMLAYLRTQSVALQHATVIPMTQNTLDIPRENVKVSVAVAGEGVESAMTTPSFEQVRLTANRFDGYGITSNELLQDAANRGGLVAILVDQFIEAFGQRIDSGVFIGAGAPMSGVFRSAGHTRTMPTGSTAFVHLREEDIRLIVGAVTGHAPKRNLQWFGHPTVKWGTVFGLRDGAGRPLFIGNSAETPEGRLYGYPFVDVWQAPSVTAVNTGFLVFGDLSGVFIGDRIGDMDLMLDPYSLMIRHQTRFYMAIRVGMAQARPMDYGRIVTAAS